MTTKEPNSSDRVTSEEKTHYSVRQLVTDLKKEGLHALGVLSEAEHKSIWTWSQDVVREYETAVKKNPYDRIVVERKTLIDEIDSLSN